MASFLQGFVDAVFTQPRALIFAYFCDRLPHATSVFLDPAPYREEVVYGRSHIQYALFAKQKKANGLVAMMHILNVLLAPQCDDDVAGRAPFSLQKCKFYANDCWWQRFSSAG